MSNLIQPIHVLSCIFVLLLSTNARLISLYEPGNSVGLQLIDRLAPIQIPAQTRLAENRITKLSQAIRVDHPNPANLPVGATRFVDQLVAECALNGANNGAFSAVYFPSLHDRAPPLHIR